MSFFVQPTASSRPKNKYVELASIMLAAVFVILAVAQLYSYEDFPDVVASLWLPGGRAYADLWAAMIVILEVAAIPFLLSMRLSLAMRIVSMSAGWLSVMAWLVVTTWANISVNAVTNAAVLGATIPISPSWYLVFGFVILGSMLAYVSWGKWPFNSAVVPSSGGDKGSI